jgi:hypothetical protein
MLEAVSSRSIAQRKKRLPRRDPYPCTESGEAAVEICVVKFLDLSLERILTRPLDAWGRINVGRHIEIMRATPKTRFEDRMIGLAGARIAGDLHFMFPYERGQALDIHRVDLNDDKAVARHSRRKLLCEDGFDISKHNAVKALEFVQLLPNN